MDEQAKSEGAGISAHTPDEAARVYALQCAPATDDLKADEAVTIAVQGLDDGVKATVRVSVNAVVNV